MNEADREVDELLIAIGEAEADCEDDYGKEALEAGGWIEITRSVLMMSDASDEAKLEICRIKGLEYWIRGVNY